MGAIFEDTDVQGNLSCNNLNVRGELTSPFHGAPFVVEEVEIFATASGSDVDGDGSSARPYASFQRAIQNVANIAKPGTAYAITLTELDVEPFPEDYLFPVLQNSVFEGAFGATPAFPFFVARTGLTIRARPRLLSGIPPSAAVIGSSDGGLVTESTGAKLVTLTITTPRASWAGGALKNAKVIRSIGSATAACVVADSDATHLFLTNDAERFNGGTGPLVLAPGEEIQIVEVSATFLAPPGATLFPIGCFNVSSINFQGIGFRSTDPSALNGFALGIGNMPAPFFELCDLEGIFSVAIADELALKACSVSVVADCEATALVLDRCLVSGITQYLYLVGTIVDFTATVFDGWKTASLSARFPTTTGAFPSAEFPDLRATRSTAREANTT